MSAVKSAFVGYRVNHRFAIYRREKPDGAVWFAAHDAATVTDADVRAGKRPRCVRIGADLASLEKWCGRKNST